MPTSFYQGTYRGEVDSVLFRSWVGVLVVLVVLGHRWGPGCSPVSRARRRIGW